ncbi:MAG: ATP-binding protein, partial [Chthoniobacteraceae bacterium]
LIPADRQSEEAEIVSSLRAGQAIEPFETTRVAKDGRKLEVSLSISPVRNQAGAIMGASKIVRDITARKQAEAALVQQREWFEVTLSSIGDGVIATNAEGVITFLNPVAEKMTGWTSAEARSRALSEIFHIINEGTRAPVESPLDRVLREGTVVGLANHTVLIARDRREIAIEDSAAPIKDAAGNLLGAVMVFHDVTERRRATAALAEAHARAEAANRAKDDFLAVLSHELRTPLTPALMAASELETELPSDPAALRASIALIRRNIELEARLVDDLLDLTRISRGKLRIASAPVDLHVTLRDALAIAEPMLRERRIAVVTDLAAERHLVRGDAARLAQIFANLLTNAAKFTPEAGHVTVCTQSTDGTLRVEVSDTGIGIMPEVLPQIFEAFRQGEVSTTRRFGGLGLGLSVAKSLVEAHGGKIEAQSEGRDHGATFCVTLPALEATLLDGQNSVPAATSGPCRSLRVLIVEDHEDTRQILQRLITRAGHTVTATGSVREAREALAEQPIDLVFTDLGLPDGTGFDVIAALREKSDCPAVAMSGYGMNSDLERTHAAGFTEHLVKPVAVEVLRATLARLSATRA